MTLDLRFAFCTVIHLTYVTIISHQGDTELHKDGRVSVLGNGENHSCIVFFFVAKREGSEERRRQQGEGY